jgi:hypothetical protein
MPRNQCYRPTADTERSGHRGQGGRRSLTVHGTRTDTDDQRAIMFAAYARTSRSRPDPHGNAHYLSVHPALRSRLPAGRHRRLEGRQSRPHLPPRRGRVVQMGLWDGSAGHDPLHRLPGDVGDEVVAGVVMHHGDTFPLSHGWVS